MEYAVIMPGDNSKPRSRLDTDGVHALWWAARISMHTRFSRLPFPFYAFLQTLFTILMGFLEVEKKGYGFIPNTGSRMVYMREGYSWHGRRVSCFILLSEVVVVLDRPTMVGEAVEPRSNHPHNQSPDGAESDIPALYSPGRGFKSKRTSMRYLS